MNRRDFITRATATAAMSKAALAAEPSAPASNNRPNFLFIIADDLTFRVFEQPLKAQVKTPHLDRLRSEGCVFSHCFHQGSWSGAVCVPSRTMLNTGLSTFHAQNAIAANQSFMHPTWGQTFHDAGYDTFITGKWHLDAVSLQRSFKKQSAVGPGFLPSTPNMYDRPAPGNTWNPADQSLAGQWIEPHLFEQKGAPIEHSSVVYADAAIEYLAARQEQPFLMYVGFNAPHDPRQAPQEFLDLYPEEQIQLPPNYVPSHPFDQGMARDRDETLAPFPRTEAAIKTHRREYYAIITHMDAQIGRILDALHASGKDKNTYVIFTADHGLSVGEHGLMGKQNQYECSMRMPLSVRGPGIPSGKVVDELVYQHCVFPTTCELANIPIPPHVEFKSLKSMLHEAQPQPLYPAVFGWMTDLQRSVRTAQYRLIYYAHISRYQLFDLSSDPWELNDLAQDPSHASNLTAMQAELRNLQQQLGDPMLKKTKHPEAPAS